MKIKNGFIRHKVADSYIVAAIGGADNCFDGMLKLNETGNLLWERVERGATVEELICALTDEYEVTPQKAAEDVARFLDELRSFGCIDN